MTTSHHRRTLLRTGFVAGLGAAGVLGVRDLATAATASLPSASARAALASSASCAILTPEETEGPYWVDERLNRSDIRGDSETGSVQSGIPLTLTITVQDAGADCTPQVGSYVDIWHCNAQGRYSDEAANDTTGVDWLRGYQVTDDNGQVTFTTIYPGWYTGRTIHIHLRIRTALDGAEVNFTSQIYFDETTNNAVLDTSAYQKSGTRTTNAQDDIYDAVNQITPVGSTTSGYTAEFVASLDFGDGVDDPTDPGDPGEDDQMVAARVVDVRVVRRGPRGRRRIVKVRLRNREKVAGRIRLVRHDDVLARRTLSWLPTGRHTVSLAIPRSVRPGPARIVTNLVDAAGNARIVRTPITVPALKGS